LQIILRLLLTFSRPASTNAFLTGESRYSITVWSLNLISALRPGRGRPAVAAGLNL
jgi:hypothetical protein